MAVILHGSSFFFSLSSKYSLDGNLVFILSILLLIVSTFISGRAFSSRAIGMRHCYERLGYLYTKAIQLDEEGAGEEIDKIAEQYYDLLRLSENHASVDFYWALIYLKLRNEECTKSPQLIEIIVAVSGSILRYFFALLVFASPLAMLFWDFFCGG